MKVEEVYVCKCSREGDMASSSSALPILLLLLSLSRLAESVRFVLTREECFTENVEYDGDMVHVSFVVISYEHAWNYQQQSTGVDLSVGAYLRFPSVFALIVFPFLLYLFVRTMILILMSEKK